MSPRRPRVFLHVGTPKTGTSFVQDLLWANRPSLRAAGLLYPGLSSDAQFHAAMDLAGAAFQEHPHPAVPGAWDRLVGQIRAWRGDAVISHELLGPADPGTVRRALDSLNWADVHIVATARDLARQVPAVWQEDVKNRQVLSFAEFARELAAAGPDAHPLAQLFWRLQDVPEVLGGWSAGLPEDRVRVVTVPGPGRPPEELWRRFAEAVELAPAAAASVRLPEGGNRSMGVVETNVLRRLNLALAREGDAAGVDWPTYDVLVKDFLALSVMGAEADRVPLSLPGSERAWVAARAEAMVTALRARPYRVIGDLDELRPAPANGAVRHPDDAGDGELLDGAVRALAGMLRYAGEHAPPRQPGWRTQVVRMSERHAALGRLRRQFLAVKARRSSA